ncbi:MAG: crossover junction endodeoxyribonuclease RuvC [Holosporales bacterium]|jgi:crossover junction endodeoxyribonuclease RuvC|nr:crossover junction endodeoxyribonuclease RuvC [Holosporales bacterium]
MSSKITVLGVDPGLNKTGWGIVSVEGNYLKYLAHGVIQSDSKNNLAERLNAIYSGISEIIVRFLPTEAAIEEIFMNSNPSSALKLGAARAAAMLAPAHAGISVNEYGANKVKKAIVGVGHADKSQIAMMIRRLMPTCPDVKNDAADALAVAICHINWMPRLKGAF